MMKKAKRQEILLKIIEEYEFDTQNDLVDKLNSLGLEVAQATVSRDINELNIVKINGKQKRYRYALNVSDASNTVGYKKVVESITCAQNLIVVKTHEGNANAVASFIDKKHIDGVVGTLAGDDNLLIITADNETAERVKGTLDYILK